jgi:hypothetical protein
VSLIRRPGARFNRGRISVSGGAAAADDPLTILAANLLQWHRGDLGITLGTGVSAWADQSGNGWHSTQGTGSAQPTYTASDATLDNQATLTGDGSNDQLVSSLTADISVGPLYFRGIIKQNAWTGADGIVAGTGTNIPRLAQTPITPFIRQAAVSNVNSNDTAVIGNWFRFEALWSATPGSSYLKIGSVNVQTGDPGTGTRTASLLFAYAGLYGAIAIAEVIYANIAPSAGQRAALDSYQQAFYPSAGF